MQIQLPEAFGFLFEPARFKVAYGGRGSGKSWSFARALDVIAFSERKRILCAREFQNSIADSVHRLLVDQINSIGLAPHFHVTQNSITALTTGSEFLFKGLRHNANEIKSTEGIDIAWVEEAQRVSKDSWELLIPTIRKEGSEIWVSFNPEEEEAATPQRFITNTPPNSVVKKVSWRDNPYFPQVLETERKYLLEIDPVAYEHVWEGGFRKISDAVIFKDRVSVEAFDTPVDARFFFGADWGFANDPTALIRCWTKDNCLYIDQEAFGHGVELDELWKLFAGKDGATPEQIIQWKPWDDGKFPGVAESRKWPIKGDNSRPETISHVKRAGFNITSAAKWQGSVEDGIAYLKGFRRIIVHERCRHIAQEFRLYSYKTDKVTNDILPVVLDKHNHGIDALRYALDGYIKQSGAQNLIDFYKNQRSPQ